MSWRVSAVVPRCVWRSPNLLEEGKCKLIISDEGEHLEKRQKTKVGQGIVQNMGKEASYEENNWEVLQ